MFPQNKYHLEYAKPQANNASRETILTAQNFYQVSKKKVELERTEKQYFFHFDSTNYIFQS